MDETAKSDNNAITPAWKVKEKGGFKAASFMYALVAVDNMGFIANMVSLVLYFRMKMYFGASEASNTLTNLMGSTFLLSIVGGFISDTYINRFLTSLIFGVLEVLALVLMTIQAKVKDLQPEPCTKSSCIEGKQAVVLYVSLCALALGTGGVRGALPALGADQFDHKDPKEAKAFASYFNYLLFFTTFGATLGVTFIVWLTTEKGYWWVGFLISAIATVFGFVILAAGKPFYRLQTPGENSPLLRIVQVIVVSIKNRKLKLPENHSELYEINEKGIEEEKLQHTDQFRCLDKAAIVVGPGKAEAATPWTVCTVTQIEEVKVVIRMVPIIGSTIIMNTCLAQLQTYSVLQGVRMNRLLGDFQMPAASVPVIPLVFMTVLIPLYDRVFIPFARKFTKHPSGITQLQRVGVGLVLSVVSMAVAGLVEVKRRHHSLNNPLKPIHVLWLSFQYGIFGIADMFTLVGLLEFFYREAPSGMRSLSTSFTWISLSFGYFLSSVFVDVINSVTKKVAPSKRGWLESDDLDQDNLNLFYWFLALISLLNFGVYLLMASWYKYKSNDDDDDKKLSDHHHNQPIVIQHSISTSNVPFLKNNGGDNSATTTTTSIGPNEEDDKNAQK